MNSQTLQQLIDAFLDPLSGDISEQELTVEMSLRLSHVIENELATQLGIQPLAKTQQVTILLSDRRGFTQLSEQFPPSDVIGLLNRYLARMNEIIHDHEGVIDKFMGGAIMVLSGVPEAREDDLLRAARRARRMQQAMDDSNARNRDLGMPELFMGDPPLLLSNRRGQFRTARPAAFLISTPGSRLPSGRQSGDNRNPDAYA